MKRALLLDLGNVVLGVDFRRVFRYWAQAANVDEQVFYDGWAIDQAYRQHETGHIDFPTYTDALSQRFQVSMPEHEWRAGWNDIWTQPFHGVIELLPALAEQYALYGFSNTNDTHAAFWRDRFADELDAFETIFVSSEIGLRKPDAPAFEHVCQVMASAPAQTIFLDDTRENVDGALHCGLDARHVEDERAVVRELRALLD